MKFLRYPLFLILLLSYCSEAKACVCAEDPPFETGIKNMFEYLILPQHSDLIDFEIVLGVKLSNKYHGVDFLVLDNWLDHEIEDTISIWGDPGSSCRLNVGGFQDQDTLLLFIEKVGNSRYRVDSLEAENDYSVSACGTFFLYYEEEKLRGRIYDQYYNYEDIVDYETFKTDLLNQLFVILPTEPVTEMNTIRLYPNPVQGNWLIIEGIKEEDMGKEDFITIYDTAMRRYAIMVTRMKEQELHLNVGALPKGCYYLVFGERGYRFVK